MIKWSYCSLGRNCPSAVRLWLCNFSLSSLSSKIPSKAVPGRIMQIGFTLQSNRLMLRPVTVAQQMDSSL